MPGNDIINIFQIPQVTESASSLCSAHNQATITAGVKATETLTLSMTETAPGPTVTATQTITVTTKHVTSYLTMLSQVLSKKRRDLDFGLMTDIADLVY